MCLLIVRENDKLECVFLNCTHNKLPVLQLLEVVSPQQQLAGLCIAGFVDALFVTETEINLATETIIEN